MPIRWSRTLVPTTREVPAEAEVPSHRLLLKAGMIRRLGAGTYTYLPLGRRVLARIERIIREEMAAAGAEEILMPALQPLELWERTGRRAAYGENLFTVTDRHAAEPNLALGPTHEEVITELVGAAIHSYRDLPLTLYQIQTKFRDEYRPRFGVLRSREFQMKDAYSFHLELGGPAGLDATYEAQYAAYERIFTRCGLPYEVVEAASGPIGGSASHEFMVPSPTGEDVVFKSDAGDYAANVEKAAIGDRAPDLAAEPTGELETLHTPGCPGIADVQAFFKRALGSKLKAENMLKTLVMARPGGGGWVVAVVRGDHELNEAKLAEAVGEPLVLAGEDEAAAAGFAIGYVGPHVAVGREDVRLVVDPDAARGGFWVSGANRPEHHVRHFNWGRDVIAGAGEQAVQVADIRNAVDGDPAPRGGGTLRATPGIEVGHVFKLGTKYSEALGAEVLDESNRRRPLVMGCYGIGVNRIMAAAIERAGGHDEEGILWPAAIAPFDVLVTTLRADGRIEAAAEQVAAELEAAGLEVLLDDRDERPGVKFKDGDLVGIPWRVTVGPRGLEAGEVEIKARSAAEPVNVPLEEAAAEVRRRSEA